MLALYELIQKWSHLAPATLIHIYIYIYILVMGGLDDYSLIVDRLIGFFGILTDRLGFSINRQISINRRLKYLFFLNIFWVHITRPEPCL